MNIVTISFLKLRVISFCLLLFLVKDLKAGAGVDFQAGLTWSQIIAKAKLENKYIFVACYQSTCRSCFEMDADVYDNEEVAKIINQNFISIKVKIDTGGMNGECIKDWLAVDSELVNTHHHITSIPYYLFFSNRGEIIHCDLGYKNVFEFCATIKDALNPQRQYYTLLRNYKEGIKEYNCIPYLVRFLEKLDDDKLAHKLAFDYTEHYLFALNERVIFTKEDIYFVASYLQSSTQKGFKFFLNNKSKIDHIVQEGGFAEKVVDDIIYKEDIYPKLQVDRNNKTREPEWSKMERQLRSSYTESDAQNTILNAKIRWCGYFKSWPELAKWQIIKLEKNSVSGVDTSAGARNEVNNLIFTDVFVHCKKRALLRRAVRLQERIVNQDKNTPEYMDTYANLLYKLGKRNKAILFETSAHLLKPKLTDISENLIKMKNGRPTWLN